MATRAKGESKRGLVVTLVFFVIATIGLGTSTYYGFAEQEALKKDKDAAVKREAAANEERDWYRFQSGLYRAYLGEPAPADTVQNPSPTDRELKAQKPKFDAGSYGQNLPEYKDVRALAEKLKQRSPWDPNTNKPQQTPDQIVKARDTEIADLKLKVEKAEAARKVEEAKRIALETRIVGLQTSFDTATTKIKSDFANDRKAYDQKIVTLEAALKKAEDTKNLTYVEPIVAKNEQLNKDVNDLTKKVNELNARLLDLQQKLATTASEAVAAETKPETAKIHGRILRISPDNRRKATIDLGRIHGLTPQTTFAVHGRSAGGLPDVRSKANIEVVNVGETTSEVYITLMFHPDPLTDHIVTGARTVIDVLSRENSDPLIPGDLLINPLWRPNSKTHIAIAGLIDLYGTGAVNMNGFIAMLERQNIIVDAYVDPLDGTIKGKGVTRQTDAVLLGADPTVKDTGVARDEATLKLIAENINRIVADGKKNAVPLKQVQVFLRETGFHVPRTVIAD